MVTPAEDAAKGGDTLAVMLTGFIVGRRGGIRTGLMSASAPEEGINPAGEDTGGDCPTKKTVRDSRRADHRRNEARRKKERLWADVAGPEVILSTRREVVWWRNIGSGKEVERDVK